MKRFLIFVLLLSVFSWASAQVPQTAPAHKGVGKIAGSVKDSTNQQLPVEFASIALIDASTGKTVDGALCDDKGKFTISKIAHGRYDIAISFMGFSTKTIRNIEIGDKRMEVDLGTVMLGQSAKVLKEVTIEGQKTLVEEKVDRTIYNAENDQTTKGGDATDVLKRVPMLSVDMDGNVSLRGSQNIKVLINNKPSTITASSVADALKQIPADQIKTVEVITSPSAKYDAEGSAGIINIITKKNTMQGFTMNVDGSSGFRGSNLGINGSYRQGKMGFSLGGFGRAQYNVPGEFQNVQVTNPGQANSLTNIQNANTKTQNLGGNYTLGWDYDIDKKNSLAASVRFSARDNFGFQNNLLTQTITPTSSFSNTRNVKTTNLSQTVDMNLTYTHAFEKPQRELNVLAMYSRNNLNNNFLSGQLYHDLNGDTLRTRNVNTGSNTEATVQVDYQTPLGEKSMLETGAKNIMRTVASDYTYFNAFGPNYIFTPINNGVQRANVFSYKQNITAGYLSYTLNLPSGYSVKAGTRYEYTQITANFQNPTTAELNATNIPAYGVIVPSINVSRKFKNGNVIKAAYNRRIQRPSIQFLNPNLQYSNQLNVTQGKTNLGPEYTDNFELGYSTFVGGSSFNLSTFARNTNKSIQSIKEIYRGDTILTTYQNIGRVTAYGTSLFAGINISNKLTVNGGGDFFYTILKNNDPIPQYNASNQGWVYSIRAFGNYKMTNGWGVQFFGMYRGRQVQLQGFQQGFYYYSVSLRHDIFNKKGSIGLGADNFLTSGIRIKTNTSSPLVDSHSTTVFHNLNFKVSFSYRIGKMTFDAPKKRRKSINNDDQLEGGDNNPVSSSPQQQGANGQATGGTGMQPSGNGTGQPQKTGTGQRPGNAVKGQPGQGAWHKGDSTMHKRDSLGLKKFGQPKDSIQNKKDSVIRKQGALYQKSNFSQPSRLMTDGKQEPIMTEDARAIINPVKKEKAPRFRMLGTKPRTDS